MKNLKKVIALIAVLALTLSTVALGATYSDVAEDSAYSVAVESLSKLGIVTGYEDGTYGPEKAVTRAEMAALIARIQGYEETASAQTATVFTDVPADFWGSGYVAAASNMGIVNGYGDGTFGPDDAVKYEQAVTMIMRTLGYEPFAAANGGYPTGYLAAAQRYGLTKNVSNAVSGTDANRGTIAQLLYNGIDTPIMAQSKWGTNGDIEYTIYDGTGNVDYKTLMSENLGVVKVKGIVVANSVTGIEDASALGIDTEEAEEVSIKITNVYDTTDENLKDAEKKVKDFMVGDTDIADALGYSVVAYVVEDEVKADEYVVVSYAKDSSTNSVVEFTLDQFDGVNGEGNIEYYKNATDNKTTELKLESGIEVVKNFDTSDKDGAFGIATLKAINATDSGKVTLIDNNNTNGYDVAIIEIGTSKVVKKATDKKITFKPAGGIEIDPEATDVMISLTKDGKAIAPSSLVEWDVITYVSNASGNCIKAEVVGSTVVGKVVSTKKSTTSVGEVAYKIEGSFYDIAKGAYTSDDIEIGAGGTFYVDKYGKIVAYNEDATLVGGSASNFALVINADTTKTFGTDVVRIQLLTANGVDLYEVDDAVKINDKKQAIDSTNADKVAALFVPADDEAMLIKYKTNSNGEITEIFSVDEDVAKYLNAETPVYTAEFSKKGDAFANAEYDEDNIKLSGSVEEDAVLFLVTWDVKTDKEGNVTSKKVDEVETKIGSLADLVDGEKYAGQKYAEKNSDDVDVIVITDGIGNIGAATNVAVITEIASEVVDGEDVLALSYYQDGELKTAYTSEKAAESDEADKLTIGDIVKFKVSGEVITKIKVLVDFEEDVRTAEKVLASEIKVGTGDVDEYYTFGYAKEYVENKYSFTSSADTSYSVRLDRAANVYVVEAGGKSLSIETGDCDDFEYDEEETEAKNKDYVFVREYDGDLMDVVIIKALD